MFFILHRSLKIANYTFHNYAIMEKAKEKVKNFYVLYYLTRLSNTKKLLQVNGLYNIQDLADLVSQRS